MNPHLRSLIAASAVGVVLLTAPSGEARAGGERGGARSGYYGGGHGGGPYRGGYFGGGYYGGGYYGGGYYGGYRGHRGHWGPGPFWGGLGLGLGVGAVIYSSGYRGSFYRHSYYDTYTDYDDGYVVVDPPLGAHVVRSGQAVPQAAPLPEPIFYPKNGQSPAALENDRRECNRWATTQNGAMADAGIFQRATSACMEGRGYTVK